MRWDISLLSRLRVVLRGRIFQEFVISSLGLCVDVLLARLLVWISQSFSSSQSWPDYIMAGILVPTHVEVAQFHHMFIPKSIIDDPLIFPSVGQIYDAMLNLVSPMNSILVTYKASLNNTSYATIPITLTFKEGTSTNLPISKKKSKSKPKVVRKEASMKTVYEKYLEKIFKVFEVDSTQDEKKKRKVIVVLKRIKKIRALDDEEPSTNAPKSVHSPNVTGNTSNVDPNNDSIEPIITSIPEKTIVIQHEFHISESFMEEGISSNIIGNLNNVDSNINMVEGISTSALDTSSIPPPSVTSMIVSTSVPVVSPTFQGVMN
ncbi:unnamed protein product [Lactuca saligna]|uniref:Uncharacterized protein n=1 Tax=Lactuca saligna TaxID=75948 RepID=A0AA35Y109_LACSI|nr:unnamed protein product [Lactuca saligna]